MRALLVALSTLALCGCQLIYKLPTRQGNVIEQKQLDQLQTGMTRDQVKFLLGTPLSASPLSPSRWDYTGYYKNPRGAVFNRIVSLYFDGDALARMEGIQLAASEAAEKPDLKALEAQEKKEKLETERAAEKTDSGVVITPK